MNADWLHAAASTPAVLVTVALAEGSVPREEGSHMLVDAAGIHGTVGGGHLELRAIEIGRAMLRDGRLRHLERFALGPSLGQCCGGVVHLAFELADAGHATLLATRPRDDSWRLVAIDGAADSAIFDANGKLLAASRAREGASAGAQASAPAGEGAYARAHTGAHDDADACDASIFPLFSRTRGAHLMQEQDGRRWLVDLLPAPRAELLLFGAGHVGAAIVRLLAGLPCHVTWIDERDDMFPPDVPANVTIEATDLPEALVAAAPAGASYLVMTHSHALDQRLTEAIMARGQVGWFGLIGSQTKRKQFEHRLRARGVDAARIAAMVCPVGLPGITGKEPAVIAVAVCAQLLGVWEAMAAATGPHVANATGPHAVIAHATGLHAAIANTAGAPALKLVASS